MFGSITSHLAQFLEAMGADWVLWLLLVLLLVALTVMIERALYFTRHRTDASALSKRLITTLRTEGPAKAKEELQGVNGMTGEVLRAAMEAWDDGVEAIEEVVQATIASQRQHYDRGLQILGTLGNSSPFIGLFGTVIGILAAFAALGSGLEGAELKGQVMSRIGEALVATAIGLGVAIPSVIAFNGFKNQLKNIALETESAARLLMAYLKSQRKGEG